MTDESFIAAHRNADTRVLALANIPEGINLQFCLQQIEGRQIAEKKLPSWAKKDDITYPIKLSLEQCSSEQTAQYKQQIVKHLLPSDRNKMVDLTGGFGIDFSFLAVLFGEAHYVERHPNLCEIARHNLPHLGLEKAYIHQMSSEDFTDEMGNFDLIYLDPSRRDAVGRKVVVLSECSPNLEELQDKLLDMARMVLVKLSPMIDIKDTCRRLHHVHEVYVLSVDGECKEVVMALSKQEKDTTYHCVNITAHTQVFETKEPHSKPQIAQRVEHYLYEPNASILKAGVQDALCQSFHVEKLHPFSHLFTSAHFIENFPGRSFVIDDFGGFAKRDLKRLLTDVNQCNLTIRNFPSTVAELRKRLNLHEGGSTYFFATTLGDGTHALLRCSRL